MSLDYDDIIEPPIQHLLAITGGRPSHTLARPYVNFFRKRNGEDIFEQDQLILLGPEGDTMYSWYYEQCKEYLKEVEFTS